MTNRQIEQVLQRMCDRLPDELEREWGAPRNHCILATRVAILALHELRIPARALPARLIVHNGAAAQLAKRDHVLQPETEERAAEWMEAGAWSILLGFSNTLGNGATGYDGHLVAVVREKWVLDLTLDQVNRAERGIELDAAYFPVPREFLRGETWHASFTATDDENGREYMIHYLDHPDAADFRATLDWQNIDRRSPFVARTLEWIS